MKKISLLVYLCAGLAACQSEPMPADSQAVSDVANTSEPQFVPAAEKPGVKTVRSLTDEQLLDASILDTARVEIGEVEEIVRDQTGTIEQLLVKVEGSRPHKFVLIRVDQLTVVQDEDEWGLRAPLTREDLMAMPSAPR